MLLVWTGLFATLAGTIALYGAAPHQKLLPRRPRPAPWLWSGIAGCGLGLALLLGWAGPATAIFMWLTTAMTSWSLVPLLCAWLRHCKENAS